MIFGARRIEMEKSGLEYHVFRRGGGSPVARIHFRHLFEPGTMLSSQDHMDALGACVSICGMPSKEEFVKLFDLYPSLAREIHASVLWHINNSEWRKDKKSVDIDPSYWVDKEEEFEEEEDDDVIVFEIDENEKVGRPKRKLLI